MYMGLFKRKKGKSKVPGDKIVEKTPDQIIAEKIPKDYSEATEISKIERREKIKTTSQMLKKKRYYHTYDFCVPCRRILLHDEHRVFNEQVV